MDKQMLSKIVLSVIVLGLCGHGCLAQTQKPSSTIAPPRTVPLDISPWLFPARSSAGDQILFPQWTKPTHAWNPPILEWNFTALTLQLSGIQSGLPMNRALLWLRTLGGVEDGGVQNILAPRYYFSPGILVTVPEKDGYVTAPPQIMRGYMSYD